VAEIGHGAAEKFLPRARPEIVLQRSKSAQENAFKSVS
jgi:hypothetical protein